MTESSDEAEFVDPADQYVGRAGCLATLWTVIKFAVFGLATVWAFGAIYYDGPAQIGSGNTAIAILWAGVALTYLLFLHRRRNRYLAWLGCFLAVLLPWLLMKKASNDRNWQPQWRETPWVEFHDDGDTVTIHHYRNFDYGLDGTAVERWEDKTVHLSNLRGADYFHDAFGGTLLAHPIISFDFGEDGFVALSVETRREIGEAYSELGGLFKMFELQYLFGDERDFIRARTNVHDEPVYLYAMRENPEAVRETFLRCAEVCNELKERPRFYNVIDNNCTTSLRAQVPVEQPRRWDYRILANGRLDELLYERGVLITEDLPFSELRAQAHINPVALQAHDDPEFSLRIREGRPGFRTSPPETTSPPPSPDPNLESESAPDGEPKQKESELPPVPPPPPEIPDA